MRTLFTYCKDLVNRTNSNREAIMTMLSNDIRLNNINADYAWLLLREAGHPVLSEHSLELAARVAIEIVNGPEVT